MDGRACRVAQTCVPCMAAVAGVAEPGEVGFEDHLVQLSHLDRLEFVHRHAEWQQHRQVLADGAKTTPRPVDCNGLRSGFALVSGKEVVACEVSVLEDS